MKNNRAGKFGFTLVEIMIVVGIIGLLVSIAFPSYVKSRNVSRKYACISNLKLLDGTKQIWALELKKLQTDVPLMADLVGTGRTYMRQAPVCPAAGTYNLRQVSMEPICTLAATDGHVLP